MAHVGQPKTTRKGTAHPVKWRDPNGAFREEWVYGGINKARARKAQIEADLSRGTYADDRRGKMPLSEVADEWLAALTQAKPRTISEYRRLLDSRVLPYFGRNRAVGSLKRSHVAAYINALKGEGLRPQTISRAYHPLRAMLNYALAEGYISVSPALRVKLPDDQAMETTAFEPRFLAWPEVERVAAQVEWLHPMYGLIVRLTALTGLRAAEVAGLDIGDVSLLGSNGELRVRRTRTLTRGRGWVTSPPKTKRSRREVPILSSELVAGLAAYLAAHPRRLDPDAPLFYGRDNTGSHNYNPDRFFDPGTFYRRVFSPATQRAGLGHVRFHDLRHTYASLMASAGIDLFKVSRWMGHRSSAITDEVYAHLFRTEPDREAHLVAALITEQRATAATAASAAEAAVNVIPLIRGGGA